MNRFFFQVKKVKQEYPLLWNAAGPVNHRDYMNRRTMVYYHMPASRPDILQNTRQWNA